MTLEPANSNRNTDIIQQSDVTLLDRKGMCFLIDISVSSDKNVTEITEGRG
jgi:hypothetical protein